MEPTDTIDSSTNKTSVNYRWQRQICIKTDWLSCRMIFSLRRQWAEDKSDGDDNNDGVKKRGSSQHLLIRKIPVWVSAFKYLGYTLNNISDEAEEIITR